ncbi:hypothetical protein FXF51_43135 [Nonomuraea sp. PA05]|nr:hypothetical protein FXF51_43135 [Nonomuraea sp. PA05]
MIRQVNQFVDDAGRLCWDTGFSCESCGDGGCEDFGSGETPGYIRDALLAEHGPSRLRLAGPVAGMVPVLKVLREELRVSLPQARELAGELAGPGLTGTSAEMEYLNLRLRRRGIAAEVRSDGPEGG